MGVFDDLIPSEKATQPNAGAFDDLVPQSTSVAPTAAPRSPFEAGAAPFDDLVPRAGQRAGGYPTADGKIDVLSSPDLTDYVAEVGKGVVEGAKNLFATSLQGLGAAAQTAGPLINIPLPGGMDPEEVARRRAATSLEASPIYSTGKAIEDFGKEALAPSPKVATSTPLRVTRDVASGAGSLASGLATGVVGGPLAAATLFMGAGQGEALQNAQQRGATLEQQRLAGKLGNLAGATDLADMLLINLGSAGKAVGFLKKVGLTAASAALEGGQEGFQQFIQNAISKGVYDPDKDLTEDVAYNTLIGAIVGGGAHPILSRLTNEPARVPTQDVIDNAFTNLTGGGKPFVGESEPPASTAPVGGPPPPPAGPTGTPTRPTSPVSPTPVPGDYNELNPPPPTEADIPNIDTPAAGALNIDIGFGYTLRKAGGGWRLVDDQDVVIATADTFSDISLKAKQFLETGIVGELPAGTAPVSPPELGKPLIPGGKPLPSEPPAGVGEPPSPASPIPGGAVKPSTPTTPTELVPEQEPPKVPGTRFDLPGGYSIRLFNFDGETELNWGLFTADDRMDFAQSPWSDFIASVKSRIGRDTLDIAKPEQPPPDIPVRITNFLNSKKPKLTAPAGTEAPAVTAKKVPIRKGKLGGTSLGPAKEETETIDMPAVRVNGKVYTGAFHPDAFEAAAKDQGVTTEELAARTGKTLQDFQGEPSYIDQEGVENSIDGFITSTGRFVGREEALRIAKRSGQAGEMSKATGSLAADDLKAAREEVEATPGINIGRVTKMFGAKLYGEPNDLPAVSLKEMFQNAFDAIRPHLESGEFEEGNIKIKVDRDKRTITMYDDGTGMTPQVLGKEFLEIAGTKKESGRSSGGFGIAKMLYQFENKMFRVVTMRDGRVSSMATSGPELFDAMQGNGPNPKIQVRAPTPQDHALFPKGHGTTIEVTVPKDYEDSEGERQRIYMPSDWTEFPVLLYSPLLSNINVEFNGSPVPGIGSTFNAGDYTKLFTVKFGWGNAHFYVSQKEDEGYGYNTVVLSNGLYQFQDKIAKNPQEFGSRINRKIMVDLEPKVKAEDTNYPFDLNRQRYSAVAEKDIKKIYNFISALYRFEDLQADSTNFGQMYYLSSPDGEVVERSSKIKIEPKKPTETPLNLIKPGDKVSVIDGRIEVNGREVPEITPAEVAKLTPDTDTLLVDQKEIDPDRVMVHDNTLVKISEVETKGILDLAYEKFGDKRMDAFLHDIGNAFKELRDVVARIMSYPKLRQEGVGVSIDKTYRGVSIRVPFSASFINPAIPEYNDPLRAGVGIVGTMVHELAHHQVRSHDANFPAEMQRIIIHLDVAEDFDFHAFKQKVVNAVARNQDIFTFINGFYSGIYTLESRGKRFKEVGSYEARDGSPPGAVGEAGGGGPSGPAVSGPTQSGEKGLSSLFQRGEYGRRTTSDGPVNLASEHHANERVARSLDPQFQPMWPQPEVQVIMDGMYKAFMDKSGGGGIPPPVREMSIHANEMNKMYKWFFGLDRLVDKFPNFRPLVRYAERIREMRLDTSKIHDAAMRIAKRWHSLGRDGENLSAFIDDITNMEYLTDEERSKGVRRHPLKAEFDRLVNKHKMSAQALKVFEDQRRFFSDFLSLITQNALDTAKRLITDPRLLADKVDKIRAQESNLRKAPYFPFLRFGSHFITVRDAKGSVLLFKTYERKGLLSAERQQMADFERIKKDVDTAAGQTIDSGVLPETAAPFVGLPPELLEAIAKELNLTDAQRSAMEQIRYDYAPAASFVKHWKNKSYTPGYSEDFLRAFSRYAFHGGRYYSRVKYAWSLRDEIKMARGIGGNTAGAIANYMEDHLQHTVLDAKGDFGALKGAIFLWVFGYSVAGAAVNLSQVPMISYPWLASKFGGLGKGDAVAVKALTRAMTDLSSFYKKGTYDKATEFEMRALEYGIQSGRISEAMASELAGMAQGNNLLSFGNSTLTRGFKTFMDKAAWMFEMSEQFNRRVTYRAALDLAMKYPNSKAVSEALNKYGEEFKQLEGKFPNPAERAAVITAAHATEQTQFTYARETRPRIMRGRLAGTILVFKTYMLNVLQLLGANKSSVLPRYAIMMMVMAGLMGLPGADDLADIAQILGRWFFGKDFNAKLALRQLILDIGKEKIPPDLVLNGFARKGFGFPAIIDLMGQHPGRGLGGVADTPASKRAYQEYVATMRGRGGSPVSYEAFLKQHSQNVPFPQVDMSRALGMGRLLPIELGKFIDPGRDPNAALAGSAQQASGAIFSVGFNLYKALQDSKTPASDWKRWEKAMPRAMSSASRAYRAYSEGRERAKGGPQAAPTIVPYDARDPEHAAEIVAMAAGFMPSRQSAQWDSIMAQAEVANKFKFERELLFGQMHEAQLGKNKEEISRVIKAIREFNSRLPQWAKGEIITNDNIRESITARERSRQYREAGVPVQRGLQPVARHIQDLFPESVVDVRRVPQ